MDLERRLYEALKHQQANPKTARPNLFKEPSRGAVRQTDLGPVWMVESSYDIGYLHGRVELAAGMPGRPLEIFDPKCLERGFAFDKVAVVDTETTGLAGGTGTYPFIIGIGFWAGEKFVVRQYILRDFSEEPSQLMAFAADLAETTSILTYNGKSFDIPLLRTRFRINRLDIPFEEHIHFDFVHPCRRLFKNHFDSLNLTLLESKLLGFERYEDVPRHLIPRLYFDYLQNRDDNLLLPILNHNRDDIIGLYLVVQEAARRVELALANASDDDRLLLSLGRIFFRAGDCRRSQELLANIKPQFAPRDVADQSLMLYSEVARKTKDWENAEQVWSMMLKSGRFGCYPHVEFAKYCEHRLKDPRAALTHTDHALRVMEFEREFATPAKYRAILDSLKRRQARLIQKIQRLG
jgi:hypothetical protein